MGYIIFVIILLLLDIAALDDITTGHQPHFILEYSTLILTALVYLYLLKKWFFSKPK